MNRLRRSGSAGGRSRRGGAIAALLALGALVLAGCMSWVTDTLYIIDDCRVDLRFGVIACPHITTPQSTARLERILRYYRQREVDAIVVAGDLTENGFVPQLRSFANAWEKVFPRASRVKPILVAGNHDWEGWRYDDKSRAQREAGRVDLAVRGTLAVEAAKVWEQLFHEPWQPVFTKTVKGYNFVGAHFTGWGSADPTLVKNALQAAAGDGSRPFFYVQHLLPRATCLDQFAWPLACDDGSVTPLLAAYPRLVAFCGHAHQSLTDADSCYVAPSGFTCVHAASTYAINTMPLRENGNFDFDPPEAVAARLLPPLESRKVAQGLLVRVYGKKVVMERLDFTDDWKCPDKDEAALLDYKKLLYAEELGDEWIVKGEPPSALELPAFPDGARVVLLRSVVDGGSDRKKEEPLLPGLRVDFPPVEAATDERRAIDYRVTVSAPGGAKAEKAVFSPGAMHAVRCEKALECPFSEAELTEAGVDFAGPLTVSVAPRGAQGRYGAPIHGELPEAKRR